MVVVVVSFARLEGNLKGGGGGGGVHFRGCAVRSKEI